MAKVKFVGKGIDIRVLDAEDLKKAGVEGFKKREFRHGEVVDVPDAVAKVLVENELYGDFEEVEVIDVSADENADEPQVPGTPETAGSTTVSNAEATSGSTARKGTRSATA